jgi:PAS domain S-box-containing protein
MVSTPHVLIVDDEVHICTSLKILLSRQGYEISTATSGAEAIEIMGQNKFDLVLLDMMIPDMSGFQIMDHISSKNYDFLIIVITGNATIESAVKALKKGAFDYLKKPFEHEELLNRVGNALKQKRLSHEKNLINGKLKRTEESYQSLVQNSPDLIYILDNENNFTFANITFEKLLGYPPDHLIGRPFESIVNEQDRFKAKSLLAENNSGASSHNSELWLQVNENRNKKRLFEISHALIKYETDDGSVTGYRIHGAARDITYRKQLEDQLLHAKKMEAIGTLASGLAHDYNNILTNILGYTSLIQMQVNPDAPFHSKLKGIEQCVDNGAKLTRQLLDFAGNSPTDLVPVNINHLIQRTSHMYGRTNKGILIETVYHPKVWTVEVNESQIEQILLNLLINAGHAMPKGGTIYIITENVVINDNHQIMPVASQGSYIKITVRDTGIGMTEETQQRIFEPFFTTKEAGKGTGLGLSSAYSNIKKHGGSITVSSQLGEGTVFSIFLPSSEKSVEVKKEASPMARKGSGTILLVDDEEETAIIGKEILESLGYNVLTAGNGYDGVELFKENKDSINLTIIDLIMPRMRGGELFDRLKKIDPESKILLASGCNINDEAQEILQRGCDGFIQKPFGAQKLSQKLVEIM